MTKNNLNMKKSPKIIAGLGLVLGVALALTACGDSKPVEYVPENLPTVTPVGNIALTSPTPDTARITPIVPPLTALTPTPGSAGTIVDGSGNIQQIMRNGNQITIILNNRSYLLDGPVANLYGARLAPGLFLKFRGRSNEAGQIVIYEVQQLGNPPVINPQPIVNNPAPPRANKGEDENKNKGKGKGKEDDDD